MRFLVLTVLFDLLLAAGPSHAQGLDPAYVKAHRIKTVRIYHGRGGQSLGERYKYNANGNLTEDAVFNNYSFYFTSYKYDQYNRETEAVLENSGNSEVSKVVSIMDKDGNILEEHSIFSDCDSMISDDITTRKYSNGRKIWQEKIVGGKPVMQYSAVLKDSLLISDTQLLFYDTGYAVNRTYYNASNIAWRTGASSSHTTDTTWSYITRTGIVYYKQRPGNPSLVYEPVFDNAGKLKEEYFHTPDSTIVRVCRYRGNGTVLLDSVHYRTGQSRVWYTDANGHDSIYYDASKGSKGMYITYYSAYILDKGGAILSSINYSSQQSSIALVITSAKEGQVTRENFTIAYNHGYRSAFPFDPGYYINDDLEKVKEYHIARSTYKNGKVVKESTRSVSRERNPRYENSKPFSFREEKLYFGHSRTRFKYDEHGNLVKQRSGRMFRASVKKMRYDKSGLLVQSSDRCPGSRTRTACTYEFYDPH